MIQINDTDFVRLVQFIRDRYGINLECKRQLIDARLAFDISRRGYSGFTEYINKVINTPDGDECHHMINKLSTNYTYFFRESDFAAHIGGSAVPSFLAKGRDEVLVWSAACSSGQEAYSAAMVLETQRNLCGALFDFKVTGTDINTDMLREAADGVYPDSELDNIPARFRRFVTHSGNQINVNTDIKAKVSWEYGNLLDKCPAPGLYDIVFCRNVMIYFTPELRRRITVRLYDAIRQDGYLYTGSTESIDLERRYFRYISPAIYQKL